MRRAFNNTKFITENDVFYGISLGWDYTSEHEWGIKGIKRNFGINEEMGVKGRTITKGDVLFKEDENLCVLTSRKPWELKEDYTANDILAYDLKNMGKNLECAWDENDFCIASKNKDDYPKIKEIYNAFNTKNIVIAFIKSGLPAFTNSSLCILLLDRIPKEIIDSMYAVDKKYEDLIKYEKKIGITKLKEKAKEEYKYKGNHYFMACSPKWIDYEDKKNREILKKDKGTKYDIQYWVNYSDDDDNYGWYIAEDIIKWLSTPGLKLKSLNKK